MKNLENMAGIQNLSVQEMREIDGGNWFGKFFLGLGSIFTAIGNFFEACF